MSIIYNNQVVAGKYTQQVVADADTVNAGIIKIATEEQINEGTDNTTAVTPFYLAQKQDKISAGDGIVIDNNEISCTINPDEQTIVRKDNGTMQCVGQLTKSNTLKFDWEGTQAEYNVAYLNGTIQPDWYCYITDDEEFVDYGDIANRSLSNLKAEGEARFDAKLNLNLDNINKEGEKKLNNLVVDKANIDLTNITDIGVQVIKDNSKVSFGFNLFDTIIKDHILTYEESQCLALQGTYVYKDAIAGSRYGYPDFYAKCVEEYQNSIDVGLTWQQPILTSNGIMGGDSFAVEASYEYTNQPAYQAFDGSYSTAYGSNTNNTPFWVTFYEPTALKVSNLKLSGRDDVATTNANIEIQACNDNETWETLTSLTQTITANSYIEIPVNSTNYYKYYRINFVSFSMPTTSYNCNLKEVVITATTKAIRQNPNGHLFYDIADKDKVDEFFNINGSAWFYGVDTENERIFLPRDKYFAVKGDVSVAGNGKPFGLTYDGLDNNVYRVSLYGDNDRYNVARSVYNIDTGVDTGHGSNSTQYSVSPNPLASGIEGKLTANEDKYLYICVGNTVSQSTVTDVIDVTTTENDTTPLFTGMYFDFTPNNLSWLKGGRTVDGADIYAFVYNELVNILNGETKYGNLKVINESEMITGIDYSEYWKVNQTDMTFTTPLQNGLYPANRILVSKKEPTTDDPSWYNLYSDGWCEQGGIQSNMDSTGTGQRTISLLKVFADTNYSVQVSWTNVGTQSPSTAWTGSLRSRSVDSFVINKDNKTYITEYTWQASGYTEIPLISDYTENINVYFKVANAVQNLEILNVGKVMEDAVLRSSLTEAQVIIETYKNGTSWYRIWSDGWCEQGGTINSGVIVNTVTLLKPYKDITYTVSAVAGHITGTNAGTNVSISARTTTTFSCEYWTYDWGTPTGYECMWQASGYIW